jgi:hypothetical protein
MIIVDFSMLMTTGTLELVLFFSILVVKSQRNKHSQSASNSLKKPNSILQGPLQQHGGQMHVLSSHMEIPTHYSRDIDSRHNATRK